MTLTAFVMGIVSACSLPLGTLTTAFWRPNDRIVAWLMAFGGGALLAALTIDLVASALDRGHFYPLAAGCITGGLLFMALDHLVNSRGGFLRKASTTINHFRRQRQRRFKRVLTHLGRIDVFRDLPAQEAEELANSVLSHKYPKGTLLYLRHDPSDNLYVIEEGKVELLDPNQDMRCFAQLTTNDTFGRMAFFAGAPHATVAVTAADTRLWIIPRYAFNGILRSSPALIAALQTFLQSKKMTTYLQERHHMDPTQVQTWVESAIKSLQSSGIIQNAIAVERNHEQFQHMANQISRLPIFQGLPPEEMQEIAGRIICKHHQRGETFFHQHQSAERLYIVEHGEVALIDPQDTLRKPIAVRDHQAFGGMSFLTGTRHTVSAVATTDTTVWVLRKSDFEEILKKAPEFDQHIKDFLQQQEIAIYLQQKQHFNPDRAARWTRKAVRSIDAGRLIPSAHYMADEVKQHHGAPLAIWLGIMLDGIPESLVIGASLIHTHISLSLLAGLFLSNYPEALSSSVGMRQQGMSFKRVLFMWTSLMVITGVGAALGNVFFEGAQPFVFSLVQGVAAGAMLTMIAETMLPEAYLKGGSIIGLATLLGFLAAIFFKTLE
jgi:CRP-like cAMP-binding protein